MSNLSKAIRDARPPLSRAAPLTYAICWGYVLVNLVLGMGMYFLYETTIPLAVANIFSYQVWGVFFFSLAVVTAYGLLRNNWVLTKRSQLAGLVLKSVWAIALIIRCIDAPQTILLTGVWLFFAYIQAVTYIHFVPNTLESDRVGMGDK